jgi:hypothetical protein
MYVIQRLSCCYIRYTEVACCYVRYTEVVLLLCTLYRGCPVAMYVTKRLLIGAEDNGQCWLVGCCDCRFGSRRELVVFTNR